MPNVLSYKETIDEVTKFLEVIFHSILYLRHVYPAQIFAQKQKYGIAVWQSRNPPLTEYVKRIVECVKEELGKVSSGSSSARRARACSSAERFTRPSESPQHTLQKVALVIKATNLDETPLERFVFDFEWLVPESELTGEDFVPAARGVSRADLDDLFRALISKVNYAASHYGELDGEVSFAVVAEMFDAEPPESEMAKKKLVPTEWFPAEERASSGLATSRLNPLRSVSMGMLNMQIMVEELEGRRAVGSAPSHAPTSSGESDAKGKGRAF
ncbi:DNA-binding protein [Leucosporidium creatinivorum]|uniref:DNA-binding protein n=1 Tax=Leucosporidium creatinivorum TaxID=106004 RepID=A0A1Y2G2L3_9BASI|nr:DNA-binding protein [Leucosporidium creatinivorum]